MSLIRGRRGGRQTSGMAGETTAAAVRGSARLRSLVAVLALGAVSWAWSEVGFWSQFRSGDSAPGWVLTWLVYSLAAGLVLRVVRRFPSAGPAALVLGGALYGWLVEGAVAATVYEALPVSLVWTGVAWHGLLTVGVGWWALPAALRRGGRRALLACLALGVVWGTWSAGWWAAAPDDGEVAASPSLPSYVAFVLVVWAAAAVGYAVLGALPLRDGDLRSRWATGACVAVLVAWAALTVVPAVPWAPVVLAALVLLCWTSLRRLHERDDDARPPAADAWPVGAPVRRLAPTLLVPVGAVATYAALSPLAAGPGEGPLVVVIPAAVVLLSLAGAAALVRSLVRAWRPRRSERPSASPAAGAR